MNQKLSKGVDNTFIATCTEIVGTHTAATLTLTGLTDQSEYVISVTNTSEFGRYDKYAILAADIADCISGQYRYQIEIDSVIGEKGLCRILTATEAEEITAHENETSSKVYER